MIAADHPAPDAALAAWPAEVRAELIRLRLEVGKAVADVAGSPGQVLDLADPAARRLVRDPAAAPAGGYAAVISIAGLVHFADLAAALRGIDQLLRPTGELWFVEPGARPGWQGLVGATVGSILPACRDLHLGRDVPHAVRSSGFLITDIKRITMPTALWPLRPFVHARAMRFPEATA